MMKRASNPKPAFRKSRVSPEGGDAQGQTQDTTGMADIFSKEDRSRVMASIPGKETKPEIIVRKFLFSKGFRYRKNVRKLPGSPDIVLKKHRTVIFVNGCFWHRHEGCGKSRVPKTREEFWATKLSRNVARDADNFARLKSMDWHPIIVWECEISNRAKKESRLARLVAEIRAGVSGGGNAGSLPTLGRVIHDRFGFSNHTESGGEGERSTGFECDSQGNGLAG